MLNFRLPKTDEELQKLLEKVESGYKEPSDPLFKSCDSYTPKFRKQGVLAPQEEDPGEIRNVQRK